MKIIQEIKAFIKWRRAQREKWLWYAPLLSLEMGAYTYEECLLAAGQASKIPHEEVGIVAHAMYCRCNRGKATLADALKGLT
jgi:hypothetical protein